MSGVIAVPRRAVFVVLLLLFPFAAAANEAPVARDFSLIVTSGRPRTTPVRAWDADGDGLSVQIVTTPAKGMATVSSGALAYTPNAGATGEDTLHWRVSDGIADSAVAVCRVLIRPAGDASMQSVAVVVRDLLLPEISAKVDRLCVDLESEGYHAELLSYAGSSSEELWQLLVDMYDDEDYYLGGALLIGQLPLATSTETGEISDFVFWNLFEYRRTVAPGWQIWVGRICASDAAGEDLYAGDEVTLIERALDANHEYRTGESRYSHAGNYFFDIYSVDLEASAARLRETFPASDIQAPRFAWPECFELMDETTHGQVEEYNNGHVSQWKIHDILAQTRFAFCSSCSSGAIGGIVNNQILTRGGGNVFSVGASCVAYVGFCEISDSGFADAEFRSLIASGEAMGQSMLMSFPGQEPQRTICYGDPSLPVMLNDDNAPPVIVSLGASAVSGVSPLTVTFDATAHDPDGSISAYEWFPKGHDYGRAAPMLAGGGSSIPGITQTYLLPHRYMSRIEVVDEWGARSYREIEIAVAHNPAQVLRVNCGSDIHKRTWQTWNADLDFVDSSGRMWLHDQQYVPGTWGWSEGADYLFSGLDRDVLGTDDDVVHQRWRMTDESHDIAYRIPLPDGTYELTLYFADLQSGEVGARMLDVAVEGAPWLDSFDVVAESGGRDMIVETTRSVDVADGLLEFVVSPSAGASRPAILNAFSVTPVSVANTAPSITGIADVELVAGQTAGPFAFSLADAETPPSALEVQAYSSDPAVVQPADITLAGTTAERSVAITPAPSAYGSATVIITVSDSELTASTSFMVTVAAPIRVLSPDGGEYYYGGQNVPIIWTSADLSGDVDVSLHDGVAWSSIISETPNDGRAQWLAPNTAVLAARIEVAGAGDGVPADVSDGTFSILTSTDLDGDGMADGWEDDHSLDPTSPVDAGVDADGDGAINLHEFLMATDPRDAASHPDAASRPIDTAPETVVFREGLGGYDGTTDTFIDEYAPTSSFGDEPRLDVYHYAPGEHCESLIRFDLSSIPATGIVTSATLRLWNTRANSNDAGDPVEVRTATEAWSESLTWNDGVPAASTGFVGPSVAALSMSPTQPELWEVADMGAAAQEWVASPTTNHGVLLRCSSNLNLRLVSSESAAWPDSRPTLTVTWTPSGTVVPNQAPVLTAPALSQMIEAAVGEAVLLEAAATDADDDAASLVFSWDVDASDGLAFTDGDGADITHAYTYAGTFAALVRVRDPLGAEDYATITLNVTDANDGIDSGEPVSTATGASCSPSHRGSAESGTLALVVFLTCLVRSRAMATERR